MRRQFVIWFLAPALLVGVAGVHSYLATVKHQTPWEGGGFGMFSTVDKRQARFVRSTVITPRDTIRVQLPDHLNTYVERLRARPTQTRTESLAQYLADATWIEAGPDSSGGTVAGSGSSSPSSTYRFLPAHETTERPRVPVEAARVEVWRYRFVSRPYGLDATPIHSVTREASAE